MEKRLEEIIAEGGAQMKVGIYPNISNEEYHASEGISASGLKLISRSPAHYKYSVREETLAMRRGSATHCKVFEPDQFENRYAVAPECDKRTKAGKETWAELEASGKIILSADEYEQVTNMAASVRTDDDAGQLVVD